MLTVMCPGCGKRFEMHVATAGRRGKCACGAIVEVPEAEPVAAMAAAKKGETARAIDEAMRATEAKGLSGRQRERAAARNVFSFGGKQAADRAATPVQQSKSDEGMVMTKKRCIGLGLAAAVIFIGWFGYGAVTPSAWEKEYGGQVTSAKDEGDQFAAKGNLVAAYRKYQQVLRMAQGQAIHSGELKAVVSDTRAAQAKLIDQNRAAFDKARAARAFVD